MEVSAFSVACSVSCFSRGRDTPLSPFKILKGQTGCRRKFTVGGAKSIVFIKENAKGAQTDVSRKFTVKRGVEESSQLEVQKV